MSVRAVEFEPTFEGWQAAARALLREGVPPADVRWRETASGAQPSLIADATAPSSGAVRVPRRFLDLARRAAAAPDPARWQILYETLWRLVHENHDLLNDARDPGVRRLSALAKQESEGEPEGEGAARLVPEGAGLAELRVAAARCTGCDLYRHATQTVFGRGPDDARIVLVGESTSSSRSVASGESIRRRGRTSSPPAVPGSKPSSRRSSRRSWSVSAPAPPARSSAPVFGS